jgi:lysophospholipase L1-like esterase
MKYLSAFALLCLFVTPPGAIAADAPVDVPAFHPNDRILFQGDSITDMNRGRTADPNHILGHSYVFIIAARYGAAYPDRKLTFINRGISGNTVADLARRWERDTLALKPDILSILIGVNDLGHGVSAEQYEESYDRLLADTVKALPNVRLILGEPFGLPSGKHKEDWDRYSKELAKRRAIVEKLAAKYRAPLAHFQKVFDDACAKAPADYWIWDGVHPTYNGHQLMADEWVHALNEAPRSQ